MMEWFEVINRPRRSVRLGGLFVRSMYQYYIFND